MKTTKSTRTNNNNVVFEFIAGQIAAAFFAVPTAALVWLATNRELAFWGQPGAFLGAKAFWLILGFFASVSIFLPNLFPSLLGKVWHGLIKWFQWFH